MEENSTAGNVPLEGGSLCLDFTNTLSWRETDKRRDLLNSFSDLVLWGTHVGILKESDRQDLLKKASQNSDEAKRVYESAILLRELLFRLFSSIAGEGVIGEETLSEFNGYFADTMGRACCIRTSDEGFAWSFCTEKDSLEYMLDPIVKTAADLLISQDLKRVKICADSDCGWLFVDKSRNSSRRWCNMNDCGNRAKARRHYQRTRKVRKPGSR
jgi:predicted RNA-binding Zn ribbon-like protein